MLVRRRDVVWRSNAPAPGPPGREAKPRPGLTAMAAIVLLGGSSLLAARQSAEAPRAQAPRCEVTGSVFERDRPAAWRGDHTDASSRRRGTRHVDRPRWRLLDRGSGCRPVRAESRAGRLCHGRPRRACRGRLPGEGRPDDDAGIARNSPCAGGRRTVCCRTVRCPRRRSARPAAGRAGPVPAGRTGGRPRRSPGRGRRGRGHRADRGDRGPPEPPAGVLARHPGESRDRLGLGRADERDAALRRHAR